ncbi:unnamed protein product [Calicophoron daubneyi]|uniref:Chitinase domain-containing protein 1 n=1 Tax=Calicophoron daubneyi TaxID=300641 RepID=A0AAV2T2P9_CALDB
MRLKTSFSFVCLCIVAGPVLVSSDAEQALPRPSEDINTDELIDKFDSYNRYTVDRKELNTTVLVYVTPWNKHGYEIAEIFARKFTHVSPVWFEVTGMKKSYTITGVPNIDKDWILRVRAANPAIKIVPRIIFGEWRDQDFIDTLGDTTRTNKCISNIVRAVEQYGFDGAVIEIWSQFSGADLRSLIDFVIRLGDAFRASKLTSVLVIPPPIYKSDYPGRIGRKSLEPLFDHIDYFSLMTYDYSSPVSPGPSSPLNWVKKCVELLVPSDSEDFERRRSQLLVGLNFYGMDYIPRNQQGEPILGSQLIDILKKTKAKLSWNKEAAEHFFKYTDAHGQEHLVFYPTLMSIARRISAVNGFGSGVSIWEIGQGQDSFYTLF